MISWFRYVPHENVSEYLLKGWEVADTLWGTKHGDFSVLMKAGESAWLPVVGWEGLYEVSRDGRVRSLDRMMVSATARCGYPRRMKGRELRPTTKATGGYPQVTLHAQDGRQKRYHVAHLVAAAWIGPRPDGMEVCHNNGNNTDNRSSNLRYDSRANNEADKLAHGTLLRGEALPHAKLTEAQVRDVRRRAVTQTSAEISSALGVSRSLVDLIIHRRAWAHLATLPGEVGSAEIEAVRKENIRRRRAERMAAMNRGELTR